MPYARDYPAPWYPREGDRVRINASPECPAEHDHLHGVLGLVTEVHDDEDDELYALDPDEDDPEEIRLTEEAVKNLRGHFYWVDFYEKQPTPHHSYHLVGELFAAIELEPAPILDSDGEP